MKNNKINLRSVILYAVDVLCAFAAFGLAIDYARRAQGYMPGIAALITAAVVIAAFTLLVFAALRINNTIWRYSSERDYAKIFIAACFASGGASALFVFTRLINIKWQYFVFAVFVDASLTAFSRVVYRLLKNEQRSRSHRDGEGENASKRLMIVGAGSSASIMISDIRANPSCGYTPVVLLDDDPEKIGRAVKGVNVVGSIDEAASICKKFRIDEIFVAIPSATNAQRARILESCAKANLPLKILPLYSEIEGEESNFINRVRDITPEELLGREPLVIVNDTVGDFITGKVVAVTGGGGSIGSEICRQVAAHNPKRLVIIDIYENNAYGIQQELVGNYGSSLDMQVYIASVREQKKIDRLFSIEKPDIVFHAAAHKHVPLMEISPDEAVKNNIFGTYNTALAARDNGVGKFVLISTDKAVNPTNIMGATKRVCEMIIQYFESTSPDTTYAAVRFGNVLGSNGSVIPLFKEQIKNRHDLTITHPEIIRYFMTIPEASQLVLTAGAMAKGSEIFVLDMGQPVKILDLAKKMISLSGLRLGEDINIKYIGLRPGEKLYEELLMSEEGLKSTLNEKIFISNVMPIEFDKLKAGLDSLKELVANTAVTQKEVEEALMEIVPTFKRYIPPEVSTTNKQ